MIGEEHLFSVFLIFQNSGQASNYPHQWGRKWAIQSVLCWLASVSLMPFSHLIGIPQGVCRFGIGWTERKSLTSLCQHLLIWLTESSTESRSIEREGTCMSRWVVPIFQTSEINFIRNWDHSSVVPTNLYNEYLHSCQQYFIKSSILIYETWAANFFMSIKLFIEQNQNHCT